jgi:hypothetical protein
MASALIRWVALLAMFGVLCPQLAAGLLAFGNFRGDHEFRCSMGDGCFEITLHHRDLAGTGKAAVAHRHTWIETLVVGRGKSNDEPDHHFVVGRPSGLVEDDDSRVQDVADAAGFEPEGQQMASLPICVEQTLRVTLPEKNLEGLSPPQCLRRGVIMRL